MPTLSQWKHTYPYEQQDKSSGAEREDQAIGIVNVFQNLLKEKSVITMPSQIYISQYSFRFPFSTTLQPKQESSQITWLLMGHLMYLETSNTTQDRISAV